jgi:hypothetical protein
MPRATLSWAAIALWVGAICTVVWIDAAPTPRSGVLVGYGESAPGAANAPGAASFPITARFSITGSVGGLFPGRTFPLVLTLTNPLTVAIKVSSITTTVRNPSTLCVAGDLTVTSFSGHVAVGARKSAEATVHVTLAHSTPDACQGAHFPFLYRGLATAARR